MYRDYLCAYTSPSDVHFIHYDINTLLYFHTAVAPFTSFPSRLVSTSAIRQSILNENSCNPVVKAAATSILSIATRQSPSRVENVRKRLAWLHMYNNYILKNCSALHTPKKTNEVKLLHVCVCVCVCMCGGGWGGILQLHVYRYNRLDLVYVHVLVTMLWFFLYTVYPDKTQTALLVDVLLLLLPVFMNFNTPVVCVILFRLFISFTF